MGLRANNKYHGEVVEGSTLIESQKGTLGFQVYLTCADGDIDHTIWLTPNTRASAEKTFTEALGVPKEKLTDGNYLEMQLGQDIVGRQVTFTTVEEEYKGKSRVKVGFLFKRSATSGQSVGKAAAKFFGNVKDASPKEFVASDDDIPF